MRTRREVLSGFGAIPLAAILPQADPLAEAREGRDKELLVEATTHLADDKPTRARLLLHTLLEVDPESPLAPLAETLLFYSLARERSARSPSAGSSQVPGHSSDDRRTIACSGARTARVRL